MQQIGSDHVHLTQLLAHEFASLPGCVGERPLKMSRLRELELKLREGRFHTPRWATVQIDGRLLRLDGQHSSKMLAGIDDDFPKMDVDILRFSADSELEVAFKFADFDPRGSTRSSGEVINAHARIHENLSAVSNNSLLRLISGVAYAKGLVEGNLVREFDRPRLLHDPDVQEFLLWGDSIAREATMKRAGIVAAMWVTWSKFGSSATPFWLHVRDGDEERKCASRRLFEGLLGLAATGSRSHDWDPRQTYAKAILAWNASIRKRSTRLSYREGVQLPKPIPPTQDEA